MSIFEIGLVCLLTTVVVGTPISVLTVAALATPVEAQDSPSNQAGVEAWQRADYAGAVAIWRPRAEQGDTNAAFGLGQAYRLGRGVPTDLATAKNWFELAARGGHVDAQTELGLLLFQDGHPAEGLQWLKMAADHDEPRALLVYGAALFHGDGVPQDIVLARKLIDRAAGKGLAQAKTLLAQIDESALAAQRQQAATRTAEQSTGPIRTSPVEKLPNRADPLDRDRSTGAWRVQLGAFSHSSSAETLFKHMVDRGWLAGKRPFFITSGSITRLQVGPFSNRVTATDACTKLSANGQSCFPIRGN